MAANRVAAQLLNRTVWRYAAQGTPAMLAFLQGIGRMRSNDITLFDAQGARALPLAALALQGRAATRRPGSSALIAPPPSVQSIEFPDGKLVVRANASRAAVDAWDYVLLLGRRRLALLVAVNALVFWLVGRTVRPFGQIVGALDAAAGRALRRRAAAAGRARGRRHRRGLQPHGRRAAATTSRPSAARVRAESAAVRQPRADALDRPPHRAGAPHDRARAARRARPVGDRDAQHGAVDRAAHARPRPAGRAGGAR